MIVQYAASSRRLVISVVSVLLTMLLALSAVAQSRIEVTLRNGDTNGDGIVDDADVTCVILDFGTSGGISGNTDLDGNGTVDDADLTVVVLGYGGTNEVWNVSSTTNSEGDFILPLTIVLGDYIGSNWFDIEILARRHQTGSIDDEVYTQSAYSPIDGSGGGVASTDIDVSVPLEGVYDVLVSVVGGTWLSSAVNDIFLGYSARDLDVRGGNGCMVLRWHPLPSDGMEGFNVYRRLPGGSAAKLNTLPRSVAVYADMGLPNPATYEYQVRLIAPTGQEVSNSDWVTATTDDSAPTLSWVTSPAVVSNSGRFSLVSSNGQPPGPVTLYIDGSYSGGVGIDTLSQINSGELAGTVNVETLENGTHTIQAIGASVATLPHSFQASSDISAMQCPFYLDGNGGASLRAQLPANVIDWTVEVRRAYDDALMRSWSGSTSVVDIAWDGKDLLGNDLTEDLYECIFRRRVPGVPTSVVKETRWQLQLLKNKPQILALISGVSPPGYEQWDLQLGKSIASAFKQLQQNYPEVTVAVFNKLDYDDTMRPETFGRHWVGRDFAHKVRRWLRDSVRDLYIYGHGNAHDNDRSNGGPCGPFVVWSAIYFYAWADPTSTVYRLDLLNDPSRTVIPLHVSLARPYNLIFIDSCGSAAQGPVLQDASITGPDPSFGNAFNITTEGTFIGWRSVSLQNSFATGDPSSSSTRWYWWRVRFFNKLCSGATVSQALSYADATLAGTAPFYPHDPQRRHEFGNPVITWLP